VGGNYRARVTENCAFEVGGNLLHRVDGSARMEIRGRSTFSVIGDQIFSVKGNQTFVVTGQSQMAMGKGFSSTSEGDIALATTKQLYLKADEGVTITCGDSVIAMTKDEIKLSSKKVTVAGQDEATVRGGKKAAVKFDGDAVVTAANVKLKSSGASLELAGDAQLKGSAVKLASGGGASSSVSSSSDSKDKEKKEWVFQLSEPDATAGKPPKPLANVPVTATGHGPEAFSGTTDGSGTVKIPVVRTECMIDLVAGDYHFTFHAGAMPEDDAQGARHRLSNLGYGPGDPDAWDDDALRNALEQFQISNSLKVSPRLNAETIAKLKELHP
jgi:hypothetical protein